MSGEADNAPFDWRNDPWKGCQFWGENRDKNVGKLAPYVGQVVAWYPDGSDIWGADVSIEALRQRLMAAGEDPWPFVFEFVEETII
jgi:hypothetical protein